MTKQEAEEELYAILQRENTENIDHMLSVWSVKAEAAGHRKLVECVDTIRRGLSRIPQTAMNQRYKLALVVLRDYRNGNDEWIEKMNEAVDDIQVAKFRKEIGM